MNAVRPLCRALMRAMVKASVALAIAGCSTWQPPPHADDGPLRTRAVSATNRDVRVSAAVLGSEDSVRMFGVDRASGITLQPINGRPSTGSNPFSALVEDTGRFLFVGNWSGEPLMIRGNRLGERLTEFERHR